MDPGQGLLNGMHSWNNCADSLYSLVILKRSGHKWLRKVWHRALVVCDLCIDLCVTHDPHLVPDLWNQMLRLEKASILELRLELDEGSSFSSHRDCCQRRSFELSRWREWVGLLNIHWFGALDWNGFDDLGLDDGVEGCWVCGSRSLILEAFSILEISLHLELRGLGFEGGVAVKWLHLTWI